MIKLLTIALLQFSLLSQTQTDLDLVIVIASLTQTKIFESGRDIVFIWGESTQNLPMHSHDELLHYVPEIEVQKRGLQDTQSDILIRGDGYRVG